jgi:hypothetical protein
MLALCLVGLVSVGPALAGDLSKLDCSLKLIPSNASFYYSMLRNREQVEAIARSKAWAKLKSMPGIQMAKQLIDLQLATRPELGQFLELYKQPENQQLVELLGDMLSNEIFIYGGENVVDFIQFIKNFSGSRGTATALHFPDLVIGFKLTKTEPATAQLKRLEEFAKGFLEQRPEFRGRFKRVPLKGGDFLTLQLEGSMIPWDKIPNIQQKEGEFEELQKKLKDLKLTITLGIREGYALLGLGDAPSVVEKLGAGKSLIERPEIKMLERHSDQKLTSITYGSQALLGKTGTGKQDIQNVVEMVLGALKRSNLSEEQITKIRKDLPELAKDIEPFVPTTGASVSCSFLTDRGSESFTYDWSQYPNQDASQPLTLLNHVGGSPLFAMIGRNKQTREMAEVAHKWIRKIPSYLDALLVPQLEADQKEKYQQIVKIAFPLVERWLKASETMLMPATADHQSGIVIDARLASKQWHKALPSSDKPLPMLEPAVVFSVSDPALLKKAGAEYRSIINDAIAKLHEAAPDKIPDFQLPEPQSRELKDGTAFSYVLPPDAGLDAQLTPTAGVSAKVAALTISQNHAERLLAETPLKVDGQPLADPSKLRGRATYCNIEGFVKLLGPWIEYGVDAAIRARGEDEAAGIKPQVEMGMSHLRTILEALQVFRSYSSSTYVEDKVTVTHGELVIRDL